VDPFRQGPDRGLGQGIGLGGHVRFLGARNQPHEPAARTVEKADRRTLGSAFQEVFPGDQAEVALDLFAAVAFQTVGDQQRPDVPLELLEPPGEALGMVSRERWGRCGDDPQRTRGPRAWHQTENQGESGGKPRC